MSLFPNEIESYYWIGVYYHNLKYYDEAIDALKKYLEFNINDLKSLYFLGVSYSKKECYDEAIAVFIGS